MDLPTELWQHVYVFLDNKDVAKVDKVLKVYDFNEDELAFLTDYITSKLFVNHKNNWRDLQQFSQLNEFIKSRQNFDPAMDNWLEESYQLQGGFYNMCQNGYIFFTPIFRGLDYCSLDELLSDS